MQCLQTEEQAILDIDDQVSDVCDDKDTVSDILSKCIISIIGLFEVNY